MLLKSEQGGNVETLTVFFSTYGPYLWLSSVAINVLLLLWLLLLQARVGRITKQFRRLLPSGRGNLEEVLERQLAELSQNNLRLEQMREAVERVESTYQHALQRVGIVRFNPFDDSGGDQSFCVAFLDGDENGLVLTSIFTRTQCRVYVKPIEKGHSRYPLSSEEEESVRLARDGKVKSLAR